MPDMDSPSVKQFMKKHNLTVKQFLRLLEHLGTLYRGELNLIKNPGLEYIKKNKTFGNLIEAKIGEYEIFQDRGANWKRFLDEAKYLEEVGEIEKAKKYRKLSSELKAFQAHGAKGAPEHGLAVAAIERNVAPRDTLLKINTYLTPEVNAWKNHQFDSRLFKKNELFDKYNNARTSSVFENADQKKIKQKILERFEWI
jgi:hypothetical protein